MINMDKLTYQISAINSRMLACNSSLMLDRCRFGRCLAHSEEHSVACREGRYIEEESSEN